MVWPLFCSSPSHIFKAYFPGIPSNKKYLGMCLHQIMLYTLGSVQDYDIINIGFTSILESKIRPEALHQDVDPAGVLEDGSSSPGCRMI